MRALLKLREWTPGLTVDWRMAIRLPATLAAVCASSSP